MAQTTASADRDLPTGRLTSDLCAQAFSGARAAIIIFTADRRYVAINEHFTDLTGYSFDEIATRRVGEELRLTPLKRDELMELVTSGISVGEADIVCNNGRSIAVEYVVIPTQIGADEHFIGMMWPLIEHHDWGARGRAEQP